METQTDYVQYRLFHEECQEDSFIFTDTSALDKSTAIDAKFEQTETSGLTCDVKGATTFNITVTSP